MCSTPAQESLQRIETAPLDTGVLEHLRSVAGLDMARALCSQVFQDASSLARAMCCVAYACGANAEWTLLQSLTAEVQRALDEATSNQGVAKEAAKQEEEWSDWNDDVNDAAASTQSIHDRPDVNETSIGSQLSKVSHSMALDRQCTLSASCVSLILLKSAFSSSSTTQCG